MSTAQAVQIKTTYWDIAADLHFPPGFDDKKKYPAIISAHPIGQMEALAQLVPFCQAHL